MMDDLLLVVFFVERDETVHTVDDCTIHRCGGRGNLWLDFKEIFHLEADCHLHGPCRHVISMMTNHAQPRFV